MKEVRKVYSLEELKEVASLLEEVGIPFKANEKTLLHQNPYTSNPTDKTYTVAVNEVDVPRALELFNSFFNDGHGTNNSFLMQFDTIDLVEILVYPDKYALSEVNEARSILEKRGFGEETIQEKKNEIVVRDNMPQKVRKAGLFLGYGSALLGGVFGIVMGLFLIFAKSKHTITGKKYYAHDNDSRFEGAFMIILSIVVITIIFLIF